MGTAAAAAASAAEGVGRVADTEPGHVKEAAKETAAVKSIELAAALCMVAVAVLAQVAQRRATEPDFAQGLAMGWAKRCERGWAAAAGWCWRRAEAFRQRYEGARGAY